MKNNTNFRHLVAAVSISLASVSAAQDLLKTEAASGNKLDVAIGTVLTEADKWATSVAIDYFKPFNSQEYLVPSKSGFTDISPDIRIKTGGEDAFDGILLAARGHYVNSDDIDIDFLTRAAGEERVTAVLHVFPFAGGLETNRDFSNGSLLIEGGYSPYILSNKPDPYKLGLNPFLGVFIQAGYKIWDDPNTGSGGNVDESKEEKNQAILRLKFEFRATIDLGSIEVLDKKISFEAAPRATGWYDIANSDFYYSVGIDLDLRLSPDKDFVLQYSKGSGAPNFNEGDQFGALLKISF